MLAPLLGNKVYLPRPRPDLVQRPRLRKRLDAGAAASLMLVSAPAGFGKTTLLTDWLATSTNERAVAWLSLDRGDNEPTSFWTYVITALQTAVPAVGVNELALLASPQPLAIHLILTTLLNDVGAVGSELVLVLDDYHLVDSREVQEAMAFLLDHLPPRLHLVIASRADPAVPLARLRARGDLVEIRAADLRFTLDEVAAYLNEVMDLQLTAENVAALEERTEGWIAALQLAALSMRGRDDVSGFIAGFAGDDRYIVDYLLEEVLQRQPRPVRDFLLQTSLLARLTGSLCDAVTGSDGGRAMLEALDRGNLFVVPLDDRREWYRYHHLFADVLKSRLCDESPDLVQTLHRRASDWYAQHDETSAGIEHAILGRDVARAADLVELALPAMARDRQEATVRSWVEQLPGDVLRVRPVLSNGYAGALMSTGEFDRVDRHLRVAESWLDEPQGRVVVDDEGWRLLPSGVAVHRAGLALVRGDLVATVAHAQRALSVLEEDDHLGRAGASALLGLASWSSGDLVTAHQAYATSLRTMHRAGHLADVLGLSIALADIQITQGSLRAAMRTYQQGLQLSCQGGPALRGTADMYVGLAVLQLERNDQAAARQLLAHGDALGEHNGLPQDPYRRRVAMAGVLESEGELDGAVELLDDAERTYVGDLSPNVQPVHAMRARAWIRQGRLDDAFEWVRDHGLSRQDRLSYLREYEHVTLARALIARGSLDQATGLLERLLLAATDGQRTGSRIEIQVLQAMALSQQGDVPAALLPLGRALGLAEPEGYVRMFVAEGAAMKSLLAAATKQGISPSYTERLLPAFGRTPVQEGLVDPLSQRELEVLRLLGTELSGPAIADHLVVALNTVRTHTKNIYAKLGVTNRRAAVRLGEELDLLSQPSSR